VELAATALLALRQAAKHALQGISAPQLIKSQYCAHLAIIPWLELQHALYVKLAITARHLSKNWRAVRELSALQEQFHRCHAQLDFHVQVQQLLPHLVQMASTEI
jgi:hypothetical protein